MKNSLASRSIRHRSRSGFTLMEVLLVLAILGVISAMVVPQLMGRQQQAKIDATKLSIKSLEQALNLYRLDHGGEYPTSGEGLNVLITASSSDTKWKGPYLDNATSIPLDAWENPLQYQFPGQHHGADGKPDIWSYGPDKANNTADDIANWSTQ